MEKLMLHAAENVKEQKLFSIKKMFDSLTPKTRNNPDIKQIEQKVNQVVTSRMAKQKFMQNAKNNNSL